MAGDDYISSPYDGIVEATIRAASGVYVEHAERAERLRHKMTTEFVFGDLVRKAIDEFEGEENGTNTD